MHEQQNVLLLPCPLPSLEENNDHIPSYRHALFNFKSLRCDAYWRIAFKRGRRLFQNNENYSHEILKLCYFTFSNNNK